MKRTPVLPPLTRIAAVALLVAIAPGFAFAAGEAAKAVPPAGGAPRPIKLPAIRDEVLPSGLAVRIVEDHRFPMVTALMAFPFGRAADPAETPGLCEATAELMKEGTAAMTSRQIAEELASIGGDIGSDVEADVVTLVASSLSDYTPRLMGLLAGVTLTPAFPDSEVSLRKNNMKQELAQRRSQPEWLARDRFSREVYGKHPYAVISASEASIESLTREKIAQFHGTWFKPKGAVLVITGDVDPAAILKEISTRFSAWKGSPPSAPAPPAPPARGERGIFLVDRPGSVQSDIRVGGVAITRTDPTYFAVEVMNQVIGGGSASRLFQIIREEKGWAYDAHSEVAPLRAAGDWSAVTQVRTEVTKPALEEVLKQVERLRSEKVSDQEMIAAKAFMTGIFTLQIERPVYLCNLLAEQKIYGLPEDYLGTYVAKLNAVTAEEVQAAAKRHLDTSKAAIVVVGDGSKIRGDLNGFGSVIAYNTEGVKEPDKATVAP